MAVVLWGDACGARELLLIQRGFTAPQHAGELAFPGGMVEPTDRDLPATARRELEEELGLREGLWEMGCLPDGVAKGRVRFTPVVFRWESAEPRVEPGHEVKDVLRLGLRWLLRAPWTQERLEHGGLSVKAPRLELQDVPLWGATAFVLKAWLDVLDQEIR